MIKLTVTGMRELERAFKELPLKVAKKVVRQALRKGLKPIMQDARNRAPVDTGELKKSIKLKAGKRTRKLQLGMLITAQNDHAAAMEFGTLTVAGHAYMRPAFDAGAKRASQVIEEEIANGIEREAKGLAK